jgi:uncharacterized protein (TIRG00374 family)
VLLDVLSVHFKIVRWRGLLARCGWHYGLRRAYAVVLASIYLGMITPGRVGDTLRIQYARRELGTPYADGLATIVMDRVLDLWVLAAFVGVGLWHFAPIVRGDVAWFAIAALVVAVVAPLVLFVPGLARGLLARLYARLSRGGAKDGPERFLAALRKQLGAGLARAIALTVASVAVNYVQGWLIARSLGLSLGILDVVAIMAITSLLSLVPISIAGFGVREAFCALAFPWLGLTADIGVAYGLLIFAVLYLVFVVVGLVAWQLAPPPLFGAEDGDDAEPPPAAS